MRLYHSTSAGAADSIFAHGFRNTKGYFLTDEVREGVWLSDLPVGPNEGTKGTLLLVVDLDLSEADLLPYEWTEDEKIYREWMIPAALINKHGKYHRATQAEEDEADAEKSTRQERVLCEIGILRD